MDGNTEQKGSESANCTLPPTPIPLLQQIGLSLGIDPKELTKEKLMAAPDRASNSQSSRDD
jgi:hypothetical protein